MGTPLTTSRPRSRTKRVSLQTNSVSFLQASSLRMGEPFRTITSRRNQPYTWCFAFEVALSECAFRIQRSVVQLKEAQSDGWQQNQPLFLSVYRYCAPCFTTQSK